MMDQKNIFLSENIDLKSHNKHITTLTIDKYN